MSEIRRPTGGDTASRFTLLESKLRVPSRRGNFVRRAVLFDRLRAARRASVLIVEAPTGYGKTTALAWWFQSGRRKLGWYSIDERERDPVVFLAYLGAVLSRVGADVRRLSRLVGGPKTPIPGALAELVHALEFLGEPAVIVLDNVHLLANPVCIDVVEALLEHVPEGSQLVLVTESAHGLPTERLTSEGRLVTLGVAELKMSDSEADALLRSAAVALSPERVHSLNVLCDGWAAGLYLAALVARRSGGRLDEGLLGSDRLLSDYFHAQLLDKLPEGQRDFLFEISALGRICARLCDATLGRTDSAAMLRSLAEANRFITVLPGRHRWFELHPLFRDVLSAELVRRDPDRKRAILARAADWYEAEGDVESAMGCAIAAGDLDRAATLCGAALLKLDWAGRSTTIEHWCSAIDDPVLLARHPQVAMLGSAMYALSGQPDVAERWARAAFRSDPAETMSDGSRASAWVAKLRALLCLEGGSAMREDALLAVETLAEGSPFIASARNLLGFAYLLAGDDDQASVWFQDGAPTSPALGEGVSASLALAALALLAAARDDLDECDALARRSVEIVEQSRLEDSVTSAFVYTVAGRTAFARERRQAARDDAASADRLVAGLTYALPWLAVLTRVELAGLHLALANPARARDLVDEAEEILVHRPKLGVLGERVAELRHGLAPRPAGEGLASALTPAELRLLPLLASYLSFREIAERLGVSRNTVKTQAIAIYRKLNVSSRSEAVEHARETGLLKDIAPLP